MLTNKKLRQEKFLDKPLDAGDAALSVALAQLGALLALLFARGFCLLRLRKQLVIGGGKLRRVFGGLHSELSQSEKRATLENDRRVYKNTFHSHTDSGGGSSANVYWIC